MPPCLRLGLVGRDQVVIRLGRLERRLAFLVGQPLVAVVEARLSVAPRGMNETRSPASGLPL